MAGMTITTERVSGIQTIFTEDYRKILQEELVLNNFGKKVNIPLNMGGNEITIFYNRKLAKVTSNLSETVVNPDLPTGSGGIAPQDIFLDKVTLGIEHYGAYTKVTEDALLFVLGDEMEHAKEALMVQAMESVDFRAMRQWGPLGAHIRQDADATYYKSGSVTGATTTTSFIDAARTEAANFWNGGYVTWYSGVNVDQTFQITDFNATTDAVVIGAGLNAWLPAAMPKAPATGDTYSITVGTGIVATDIIVGPDIKRALGSLKKAKAKRFRSGRMAGYFAGVYDHEVDTNFFADVASGGLVDVFKYVDNKPLLVGENFVYAGVVFFMTTQPYRETVGGVQSDTGVAHNVLIFGDNAVMRTKIRGGDNDVGVRVTVMTSRELGQPIPVYNTLGWDVRTGYKPYYATNIVTMLAGATAIQ